ncbi:ribose 5-phosphate isomerase B [Desulfurivibrio alkaliphilus]|uniref:Sugar-phosphate isomerase, RpiB/LacA/LacB family n=1 Tax=Desulfurivibrio alkaliphilus (strain DSM 19089 / UNIQEM U267 / AHT2) TaxID=589865 RepID=D6Z353_DESAT|nr:ribose 5-phosphate isomerase B [Desulfurivibrio alkaliphilus]ADH85978.1 sugar-phosphate isomerase, RpiB/LacA/LacB family [Desulfurivibrio alkaliphilus AHT 2]
MKIALGSDHGGFGLKETVLTVLQQLGHEIRDCGTMDGQSVDYPQIVDAVCELVTAGTCQRGIMICGTGIGVSMAANRRRGIRAALCTEGFSARMSREHNDANVLCLGGRTIGPGQAEEIVRIWLSTEFAGGRHLRRIQMF